MGFDSTQDAHIALRGVLSERTRPVIAWTGSGLSVPAGLPTWPQLKAHLLTVASRKAAGLPLSDASKVARAIDDITGDTNPWTSFQRLEAAMGSASFRDSIRSALSAAADAAAPDAYQQLWRLHISGILNLNLDRLATRAFHDVHGSAHLNEFNSHEAARLTYLINTPSRFVANLHGVLEDSTSWVFTHDTLQALLKHEAYTHFLRVCLSTCTILLVGISADDIAVGGHLAALTRLAVEMPTHYWVTSRRDILTDNWAEGVGIRIIRYHSREGSHGELNQFFEDLLAFKPVELAPAPPVALHRTSPPAATLPPPDDLRWRMADEARVLLNAWATKLLAPGTPEALEEYQRFSDEYDQAIYGAWYTSTVAPNNNLLGYTLEEAVARGAFGRVYRATNPAGEPVAVKVLLEEIRRNPALLQAFRRGVRSMAILQQRGIEGMVAYREASEIPAFVVMDWVDGPNLATAKAAKQLEEWPDILKVAVELAAIIQQAHALPERVLHRDIRPANVMLRNFWTGDWDVVVLDFDLSWHRGALEGSVVYSQAVGYLAPEQLTPRAGASTRHAAVDSFGMGMTLLFLCSGRDPLPEQHNHYNFAETVRTATASIAPSEWVSLGERFARLILAATRDTQSARWDMAEIAGELRRLRDANDDPESVRSASMVAEEIAANADVMSGYVWDEDRLAAVVKLPTGVAISLVGDEVAGHVELQLTWSHTGTAERGGMYRYVSTAAQGAAERFSNAGWKVLVAESESHSLNFKAVLPIARCVGRAPQVAQLMDDVIGRLRLHG